MTENKKEFRERQIQSLIEFSKTNESSLENEILYDKLFQSTEFSEAQTIGVTISMGFEMDTQPIIEQALKLNKSVYIPKTNGEDKSMTFIKFIDYEKLSKTKFGVLEPVDDLDSLNPPELVITPGLAYSNGYRLGFGAGFYDRYLAKYHPRTVSLANSKQIYLTSPWGIEPHDIPVDKIISVK